MDISKLSALWIAKAALDCCLTGSDPGGLFAQISVGILGRCTFFQFRTCRLSVDSVGLGFTRTTEFVRYEDQGDHSGAKQAESQRTALGHAL
jgi:hypothetical protein